MSPHVKLQAEEDTKDDWSPFTTLVLDFPSPEGEDASSACLVIGL